MQEAQFVEFARQLANGEERSRISTVFHLNRSGVARNLFQARRMAVALQDAAKQSSDEDFAAVYTYAECCRTGNYAAPADVLKRATNVNVRGFDLTGLMAFIMSLLETCN